MTYEILTTVFFTITGLVLASFGNMLVYRLKEGESLLSRSHCEQCKHTLGVLDLIPVFSFVFLKGRCRYCRKRISVRESLGELAFAGVAAAWGYLYAIGTIDEFAAAIYMTFTLAVFVIVISDALYLEIPDEMQLVMVISGIVNIFIQGDLLWTIFNVGFAAGLLLITFLITGDKKMGFGDVKLAFGLGFYLNYFYFTLAILISSIAGIIFAVLVSRGDREKLLKYRVPYGSFLGATSLIILLALVGGGYDPLVFERFF
ncbi:hypothetical protein GF389_04825 [Candidatus Dojkabacteria bacterium]|nr:hypothetical protein [Candidatus Dojkabacteria bacterium]